jgi:methionyl aminopeptidase
MSNFSSLLRSKIRFPCKTTGKILRRPLSTTTAFDAKDVYSNEPATEREPVKPHSLSAKKPVPDNIVRPPYASTGQPPFSLFPNQILIHDQSSIDRMRDAARLARRVLDHACSLAKPGVETEEIDTVVHEEIIRLGGYPSPLNYHGFPKSVCSSINEVICHGIPDSRPLQNGDIVSFDVSCFVGGVHGDNCATVIVGDEQDNDEIGVDWRGVPYRAKFDTPEEESMFRSGRRLVHATRESLYAAIAGCGPGSCLTEVGAAIQEVADDYGYSTVTKYRGHGIGEEFHCAPYVKVR